MLTYRIVKLAGSLLSRLSQRMRRIMGRYLGDFFWLLVPKWRKEMAIGNIQASLAVERWQARAIARASTVRFGEMILDVFAFPRLTADNIRPLVRMEGREHLEQALRYDRGVILATAHTGNWELLGAALAFSGFPIIGVAQKQINAAMDRLINEYRTMTGMQIAYKTGVRDMIRCLGEGKIVGLLMDQNAGHDGVFVDFFGRKASTPIGPAALARLKDAPIVPVFITQRNDGTHVAIVHPIQWVEKTDQRDQDIFSALQRLTTLIEQHIRQHPEEWFWLHNRWKTRPPADKLPHLDLERMSAETGDTKP